MTGMKTLKDAVLLPVPRRVTARPGRLEPGALREVLLMGDAAVRLMPAARALQEAARREAGLDWPIRAAALREPRAPGCVALALAPAGAGRAQGYALDISPRGVAITGNDPAGAFYGAMTLVQLLRQARDNGLPAGRVQDHPDFPSRGVMLDISRDKVPTMDTLFALVDQLAEWKINHLELYTEHTFAYRRHRAVWAQASPMTSEQVLRLDARCRERFVELVPNQNSFGHFERWLRLPAYRDMAEAPDGATTPWKRFMHGPHSLNPRDPRGLALLEELYDELLPNFTSRKFNVGCDETFDLGQGRSRELCAKVGTGRVYLEFLLKIHRLVAARGRTMHFWGDIIIKHPELIRELPRDAVVLEWGYDAGHPFASRCPRYAATGLPFYVCPGTSSWNSLAGRTDNCLANLRQAAESGLRNGAVGYLNTDWGDNGHWQCLPVSYLGFAAGAACCWALEANDGADLRRALDVHAFRDEAGVVGATAWDLGNAYRHCGQETPNSSVLWRFLQNDRFAASPKVTPRKLAGALEWVEAAAARLGRARMRRGDAALVLDEFRNNARMLAAGCRRGIVQLRGGRAAAAEGRRLAGELRQILGEHRRLWLARNREGGLQDSARVLEERVRECEETWK